MPTTREAYLDARNRLRAAGIEAPSLEAEVLLRHALHLGTNRAALLMRLAEPHALDPSVVEALAACVQRRLAREPTAYITGHREFYKLDLEVTPDVLIPRPETETLVELAIQEGRRLSQSSEPALPASVSGEKRAVAGGNLSRPLVVADVGTGSGAIALALTRALPQARVIASDVSSRALDVARRNAARHGLQDRILFLQGELLAPIETPVHLLVANLPYVTSTDWDKLEPEVRDYEPAQALNGGPDGLDLIRRLLQQAPARLHSQAAVLLEIGPDQAEAAHRAAEAALPGARITIHPDLARRPRVLVARL